MPGDIVPFDFGGQGLGLLGDPDTDVSDTTDWSGLVSSVGKYFTESGGIVPRYLKSKFGGGTSSGAPDGGVVAGGPSKSGGMTVAPGGDLATTGGDTEITFSQIREDSHDALGFYVTRKTMQYIIRKMGIRGGAEALGLSDNEAIWLVMHKRTAPRRHFVQTMVKQMRKARRFEHLLASVARRQHIGRSRSAPRYFRRKRRR